LVKLHSNHSVWDTKALLVLTLVLTLVTTTWAA